MFREILKSKEFKKIDLSCLRGVFCGGDSLTPELKNEFDEFLKNHHAKIEITEGYGVTECVAASVLNPYHKNKAGSVGIPLPDMFYKIVEPGTEKEVGINMDGEICISGPTVMIGYLNNKEETKEVLKKHIDGRVWLHTGDIGAMDEEGFVYFKQRMKRMIVSSRIFNISIAIRTSNSFT